MSFDSRLFRPRRSNSSSASSALVSVGVSMRRQDHGVHGLLVVDVSARCSAAQPGAEAQPARAAPRRPRPRRCARRSALACVVEQFQAQRQAVLAGADVGAGLLRAVDVEQRAPSAPAPDGVLRQRADQRGRAPRRRARPARCRATPTAACGTGCARPAASRASTRVERPARTAPAPAAARRPGASADAVRRHGRSRRPSSSTRAQRPGCSAGCVVGTKRGRRGASSASMSPLTSKKSTGALLLRPTAAASAGP